MNQFTTKKYGDITAKLYKNGLIELSAIIHENNTLTQSFKIPLYEALKVFKIFVDFRRSY
jgi:hypothetical protein